MKLEEAIGKKLYNTYYYDRFYNPGQALSNHADRPACEISVTVHISSNLNQSWLFGLKLQIPMMIQKENRNHQER